MDPESTKPKGGGQVTPEQARGGLAGAGVGLAGVCFALGFSLTPLLARVTDGGGQAPALIPAQALTVSSRPVAKAWIEGFEFNPDRIEVSQGTTVLWTNRDGVDHDVTFLERDLASPLVGKGGEIAIVFRKPGKYRYYCHVHPFMQGAVIVE